MRTTSSSIFHAWGLAEDMDLTSKVEELTAVRSCYAAGNSLEFIDTDDEDDGYDRWEAELLSQMHEEEKKSYLDS